MVMKTKIFGTDMSLKYIFFELDGKRYSVSFRDTFLKGVHDVEIRTGTDGKGYGKTMAVVEAAYPNFRERVKEICLRLPMHLSKMRRQLQSRARGL